MKLDGITKTIQRALASAGLNTQSGPMKGVTDTINQALSAAGLTQRAETSAARAEESEGGGRFLERSFANNAGTRDYKLYIPASYSPESKEPVPLMPVIVMLHGCKQSPDDFAAGTKMNALAENTAFSSSTPRRLPMQTARGAGTGSGPKTNAGMLGSRRSSRGSRARCRRRIASIRGESLSRVCLRAHRWH